MKADVVFIVDASHLFFPSNFRQKLAFVSNLVTKLNVGPDSTHVGVVTLSTSAKAEIFLNTLNGDIPALQNKIKGIRSQTGAPADIHKALKLAREEMFSESKGARSDVPKIIIMITDGNSNERGHTKKQAQLLREQGIKVFVIGIGHHLDRKQLGEIATEDTTDYVYSVSDLDNLTHFGPLLMFQACKGCKTFEFHLDVMYIMDVTHADKSEIRHNLHLIKNVTEGLGAGVRVGLTSNNCPNGDIELEVVESAKDFANAVTSTEPSITPLTSILRRARGKLTKVKKWQWVRRLAVVFVHGPIDDLEAAANEIMRIRSAPINPAAEVIIVGMGDKVDEKQIQQLSGENARMLVDKPGQPQLTWENILNEICEVLVPGTVQSLTRV